ncbi:hypothetical protein N7533_003762 [Penicillium manginii]|uniref:uncharacterized protein n=1 Tax=Penicillium manginii TaxID=203109 RepID=UPI002547B78C|nr:uncharacterized protein N7533_011738 [Penicillium manginii]XP_056960042.1 uncharacterized protein N7533_003762 [Penicillium manginii]KAJ5742329.1 hypothetical protein N7533_011738 [Penicillium manginii]KAJ5754219.1 hypothetical protein N7533_003762 [Penicillium manginii]
MVRHSSEAPSTTPGGQTTLGSSFYPPEYIWNSLSDTQRDSFMSTVSASLVAGDGQRKRPRIDLTTEEDIDDGRVPSLVLPVLPRFPGLDRAAIIAVFEHTFRPKKDLIKLRSPEFKASAPDGESFDLKSTSSGLQFRKVVSIKDWGQSRTGAMTHPCGPTALAVISPSGVISSLPSTHYASVEWSFSTAVFVTLPGHISGRSVSCKWP